MGRKATKTNKQTNKLPYSIFISTQALICVMSTLTFLKVYYVYVFALGSVPYFDLIFSLLYAYKCYCLSWNFTVVFYSCGLY